MHNFQIKSMKPGLPLLLFGALALAFSLPLRIWQQLYLVESETGFWISASHSTIVMLYISMGLLIVAPLVIGIATRKRIELNLERRVRTAEGFCALASAAAVIVGVVVAIHFVVSVNNGDVVVDGVRRAEGQILQFFMRSGAMAALLEALFGLGAAAFFANLAVINLFPEKKMYLNRFLTLMPAMWVVSRLLRRFSRTIAYLRVSDLFLTLAALVLLMLFFLALAQIVSGISNKNRVWRLVATGVPAAVLLLLGFVPRVVAYDLGNLAPPPDAVREFADAAVALFVCVLLYGRLQHKTEEPKEQEQSSQDMLAQLLAETPPEETPGTEIA